MKKYSLVKHKMEHSNLSRILKFDLENDVFKTYIHQMALAEN